MYLFALAAATAPRREFAGVRLAALSIFLFSFIFWDLSDFMLGAVRGSFVRCLLELGGLLCIFIVFFFLF